MMTVITHVTLREGAAPEWDDAMRERLDGAIAHDGWIGGQLLIPLDAPNERMIVGLWDSRADWEAWHDDETFAETRDRLAGLQEQPDETRWYEVATDVRR